MAKYIVDLLELFYYQELAARPRGNVRAAKWLM
jgi:hypothetical protein